MTGTPVITFKWFKNEIEISSGHKYAMTATDSVACLEVADCTVEDTGDYVCVACSEAGSDRCSSTVTVKGQLSFRFPFLKVSEVSPNHSIFGKFSLDFLRVKFESRKTTNILFL